MYDLLFLVFFCIEMHLSNNAIRTRVENIRRR